MAQRMESVAPPGGVMLSESTARLVEGAAVLGEPELVHIKGGEERCPPGGCWPSVSSDRMSAPNRNWSGGDWEFADRRAAILGEAIDGTGCIVNMVGPPGIGKSRLVRETAALAGGRGVPVFGTYCESHASDISFHVVARMLRAAFGSKNSTTSRARAGARPVPGADPEDLLLLDDLLGIGDPKCRCRISPPTRGAGG